MYFERIKEMVSVPEAARYYGVDTKRGNMCRCLFHEENTPSMKLYEKNYHCFGCGAHGDVIALTAQIFGTSMLNAAKRLNADFNLGLDMDKPLDNRQIQLIQRRKQEEQDYKEWENNAWLVLSDYFKLLCRWRDEYAPEDENSELNTYFVESLKNRDYVEYLCERFISGDKEEKLSMKAEVERFEERICMYRRSNIKVTANRNIGAV